MLAWDSSFWGIPIARVRGDLLTAEEVEGIDRWCRHNSIHCLYFLTRADDPETTRLAEDNGFRLVDIRMTLAYTRTNVVVEQSAAGPVSIRYSSLEDVPILQSIARDSYGDTRFYYDHHFPPDRCSTLYQAWITRSCHGYADVVLVADLMNAPAGYVTCHLHAEGTTGSIGLVGVDKQARSHGIGQVLVGHALEWFAAQGVRKVTVVTQGRNGAAQRLYQRCGFVTEDVHLWYHRWYA